MSENVPEQRQEPGSEPRGESEPQGAAAGAPDGQGVAGAAGAGDPAAAGDAAESLKGMLGRLARDARRGAGAAMQVARERRPAAEQAVHDAGEQLKRAIDVAKPEVERLAGQTKAAAQAAAPRVERTARQAAGRTADYVREHEREIRPAAGRTARQAARAATPRPLRPAVDAFEDELRKTEESKRREGTNDAGDSSPAPPGSRE